MKFRGTKNAIIFVVLIGMLLAYYFYLSNRTVERSEEAVKSSPADDIIVTNIEYNYPDSPKEVVRYYCEITKCFYNEECTDVQIKGLLDRCMELYDEELIAAKSYDSYLSDLKSDIASFRKDGIQISGYKTANSTEVEYFKKDGRECAGVYCHFSLRQGTSLSATDEVFILRKDDKGHWKIFGFQLAKKGEQGGVQSVNAGRM